MTNQNTNNTKENQLDIGTLALAFINYTYRNIFLTGGAGTGKTTLLKFLKENTHKKLIIAAPTGVAAVNAGGMTIHALFGLPARLLDETTVKSIRLSAETKLLLRQLELLVIDEVSMLRADVLDAIDYLLQEVRQDQRPLGGLQVIFIGDLYQLPPVKNQQDTEQLKRLYSSLYFTDSNVFSALKILMLELTEVHRQADPIFIDLLNTVRKGRLSADELARLNALYCQDWTTKNAIILTTHNRYASQFNEQQMSSLPGFVHTFIAEISGEFAVDQFPVEPVLRLKLDCRVMVIKNDYSANPHFFNGKIGLVTTISDLAVGVTFEDGTMASFEKEIWSNIAYTIQPESDALREVILGTFKQFPLRLAWAITVHKSQGLTFEKAVIDVADAFAAGQVYVALSRIKNVEGVFLKSRIPLSAIIPPPVLETVFQSYKETIALPAVLEEGKRAYVKDFLLKAFNWHLLTNSVKQTVSMQPTAEHLLDGLGKLEKQASNFSGEITERFLGKGDPDWPGLADRVAQAEVYFNQQINAACIPPLKEFIKKNKDDYKYRGVVNQMKSNIRLFQEKARSISIAKQVVKATVELTPYTPISKDMLFKDQASANKSKQDLPPPASTISTEAHSLHLFQLGKSVAEIAAARSLGIPAIEHHLASYLPTGEIKLSDLVAKEILDELLPSLNGMAPLSIAQLRPIAGDRLSMGQLQAVSTYLRKKEK